MKKVETDKAPKAIGPYSQAMVIDQFIFTSGQLGVNPVTNELAKDIQTQTHWVMKNLNEVLLKAGSDLKGVIKATCFLKDLQDFDAFNEVYAQYLSHKPARSCVQVARLPKDALCEVEVVAIIRKAV